MARLIDGGEGAAISLDELVDALDACADDLNDEATLASFGPILARLARNRSFLADLAIAELKARCDGQRTSSAYGAQVFLLRPPNGRYVLRANFWPARDDAVVRASGTAAFFYDLPHDHNFSFLTVGYLGPGYWSDYYEYDVSAVAGLPGEPAGLRFAERSRLEQGRVLLYRARRDVHVQLPPDAFSVSLNILAYDLAQPWAEQFRFDVVHDRIAAGLTTAPSEALVTLAAQFGGGNGRDLAHSLAAAHPSSRMRVTAQAALAGAQAERAARAEWWARCAGDPDGYVAGHARLRLAMLDEIAPEWSRCA